MSFFWEDKSKYPKVAFPNLLVGNEHYYNTDLNEICTLYQEIVSDPFNEGDYSCPMPALSYSSLSNHQYSLRSVPGYHPARSPGRYHTIYH